jgi:hypothetical protein
MSHHFLGILKQINEKGKSLKAGGPASGLEAIVPGCDGPLTRRPRAEAAWPAHTGWRDAPPCHGHRTRGREHRRVEAHPLGNKGGGGAHRRGRSTVRRKGTTVWRSVADSEGPAVAGDNARVLMQLCTSEGV